MFFTSRQEHKLTGQDQLPRHKRWFSSDIFVLEVEVEGEQYTDNGYGLFCDGKITWWRKASLTDIQALNIPYFD